MLRECKDLIISPILRDESLAANLCGINYMNDDPRSVDVIYGSVTSDKLQGISNEISKYFASQGYFQRNSEDQVKMHVTLINSLFRDERHSNDERKRITFDASKILEKYRNFFAFIKF